MITAKITLTDVGADTGPLFNLYSDANSYSAAFATNITKLELINGYSSDVVPDGTAIIKVQSVDNTLCPGFVLLEIPGITTTTSTSSTTTTSSTTACVNCSPHNVTIGSQIWTGCNLDVTTYSDGTVIPQVTDPTAWANLTTGAWCYYNNDTANGTTYGKLYNIYAVLGIWNTPSYTNPTLRKKLAPTGYHVPTDAEWTTLTATLGGGTWISTYGTADAYYQSLIGDKLKEAGDCHWFIASGTNTNGFTGLPGGERATAGYFIGIQGDALFASSSIAVSLYNTTWGYGLSYGDAITKEWVTISQGISVRLIQD